MYQKGDILLMVVPHLSLKCVVRYDNHHPDGTYIRGTCLLHMENPCGIDIYSGYESEDFRSLSKEEFEQLLKENAHKLMLR